MKQKAMTKKDSDLLKGYYVGKAEKGKRHFKDVTLDVLMKIREGEWPHITWLGDIPSFVLHYPHPDWPAYSGYVKSHPDAPDMIVVNAVSLTLMFPDDDGQMSWVWELSKAPIFKVDIKVDKEQGEAYAKWVEDEEV